jgi:hypothetical protein
VARGYVPAMATDGREARQALWARYDGGDLSAAELDARLKAVDRAGDDPAALDRAVSGHVRVPSPRRRRLAALGGAAAAVVVLVGGGIAVLAGGGNGGNGGNGRQPSGSGPSGVAIDPPPVVGFEPIDPVDCPEVDEFLDRLAGLDQETPPANPALLSDPVALPEGYSMGAEEEIVAGTDPDIAMSVSAGNPPPVVTYARTLAGPLAVTMRAWVYDSPEAAAAAGEDVLRQGVCTYDIQDYEVPDRPEIQGSTVSGVIPTTAFAGWRLGERRFSVAVQAGVDGDPEATAAAQQLAGTIAALELDAARTPPG